MEHTKATRRAMRNFLWQWGNTLTRIKRLEQERAEFRERADDARRTLRSPTLSGMPKGGKSSDLSDVVVAICKEAELYDKQVQRINSEIDAAMNLRNCIEDCVSQLTPVQEKVITYRYVDGRSWRFVAMKLNYDEDYVRKLDTQAVDALSDMLDITTTAG